MSERIDVQSAPIRIGRVARPHFSLPDSRAKWQKGDVPPLSRWGPITRSCFRQHTGNQPTKRPLGWSQRKPERRLLINILNCWCPLRKHCRRRGFRR